MRGFSNQARILTALQTPRTDAEVAQLTGIPEPSVRRTRLHLVMAGAVVAQRDTGADGLRWVVRQSWQKPLVYSGVQRRL